jgi:site-specific DNA-methyltransferase (adenine-specific)
MKQLQDIKNLDDMIGNVINADCLEVMKMMPDKSVDLILTDPPYGINYQSNMRVMSDKFDKLDNDNNEMRFIAYKEFYRLLNDNCVAICFCSFKNFADDFNELKKYFDIKNCIIWYKAGGGIGDLIHSFVTDYEIAIVAHKGDCSIRGKRCGSVWQSGKVNPNNMVHPTEKPIDLIQRLAKSFSDETDLVFDPFLGSGTTAVACEELKRRWIGCELVEKYCKISDDRISAVKNQTTLF